MSRTCIAGMVSAAVLGLAGCSTTVERIRDGDVQVVVGQKYMLRRAVILLAKRGMMDAIENPDHTIMSYKPYRDYDPYYARPIGVLSVGTAIEVKEISLYRDGQSRVIGEIVTGQFTRKDPAVCGMLKRITVVGRPRTGEVVMNELWGGRVFVPSEFTRNLEKAPE